MTTETAKPTVKLAKYKVPPTYAPEGGKDVGIAMGMEPMVFVPSWKQQMKGFTPYSLNGNERVDATRQLLTQYPGIYIPFRKI